MLRSLSNRSALNKGWEESPSTSTKWNPEVTKGIHIRGAG